MPAQFWSPDDWQLAVNLWLTTRYGLGNYQKVPDKHVGDFGIEGYSTDGNVYQSYAPDALTTAQDLYEKQRDKMTTDIGKFCNNGTDLLKMFNGMLINRWLLVVPIFDSARLVQHAATKTKEVTDRNLSYVADGFRVGIVDENDFEAEKAKLVMIGAHKVQVDTPSPTDQVITAWTQRNAQFLVTAREKLDAVLPQDRREPFVQQLARLYVRGETTLQTLDAKYPVLATSARRLKSQREQTLEAESLLATGPPNARLEKTIDAFEQHLFENIPGMSRDVARQLAWEAAADWIFRCPLNF
ncbi:MAG TPA: hypothetical protein VF911_01380 [Thermoanaerobaculia bacterium]